MQYFLALYFDNIVQYCYVILFSQLYHAKPIGYELRIKSLLLELIALLLPFCQEDSAFSQLSNEHTSKLKAVLEFIEQHYADPLSVADLASVCCFSEYHFMRFFKKYMGESAMEYVRNVRLAKDQCLDVFPS